MNGNLGWALEHAARRQPGGEAVVDGDIRRTWAELADRCDRLGGVLGELGVAPGGVVGVLSLNSAVHLECWLGVPRAGRVMNDLNFRLAPAELAFVLDDCETGVLLADDMFLETALALREQCRSLQHVVHTGTGARPDGVASYEELLAGAAPAPPPPIEDDALAGIFYTGGTTGMPKGVMLSHANLLANAKHTMIAWPFAPEDRYLHAAPMFHLADGANTYAATLAAGTHVTVPAFDPEAVARAIAAERVTVVTLVPTMLNLLVNHPALGEHDLSSLRRIQYGASPMPPELQRKAIEIFGPIFSQGYGMTEAAPIVTVLSVDDHVRGAAGEEPYATRLASAGAPVAGVQAEIRDGAGNRLPPGEPGEIWVRGPNVMTGYWNRPEETAAALVEDGWYRSGDVAYADEGGYLFIVDRAKDMIISGGENVYSVEVESALYAHPSVLEAAVVGVPDEAWGERVHAVVVLREGAAAGEDELIAHCRERIAGYKVPRSVELRGDALPKSGAGKVLKRELRAAHWEGKERAVN